MRKICAFIVGILLFIAAVFCFDRHLDSSISKNKEAVRNYRSYERFWSYDIQKQVIDENTLPIFGSSELVSLGDCQSYISSFLNSDDMNIVTIGGDYFQSLSHIMELGSIEDCLKTKKVALFLSPQWFEKGGISSDAFPQRFGEEHFLNFLANKRISDKNKEYVIDRTLELLKDSPIQLARVENYKKGYENKLGIYGMYSKLMSEFWELKDKYAVYKDLDSMEHNLPKVDLKNMDFTEMLNLAEEQGRVYCTNNDFGIHNQYWTDYVQEPFENGEVEKKEQAFTESIEYDDLTCFLDVAKELGIEVIVVSIPVNGAWYDYQGMLCDDYYKKVANLVKPYENVAFVDMTPYAHEKYFMHDVMHLGWKGWTRVNEALYREFTKE